MSPAAHVPALAGRAFADTVAARLGSRGTECGSSIASRQLRYKLALPITRVGVVRCRSFRIEYI
ncbi:hypothetical protein ASE35_19160 [Lysobacter sp. Root916]|nr:hypothetical protein ASE35_19160 [Lysobacter sp. Root916]